MAKEYHSKAEDVLGMLNGDGISTAQVYQKSERESSYGKCECTDCTPDQDCECTDCEDCTDCDDCPCPDCEDD